MKKLLFINILLIFCLKLYSNSIDFKGYPTKIQLNNDDSYFLMINDDYDFSFYSILIHDSELKFEQNTKMTKKDLENNIDMLSDIYKKNATEDALLQNILHKDLKKTEKMLKQKKSFSSSLYITYTYYQKKDNEIICVYNFEDGDRIFDSKILIINGNKTRIKEVKNENFLCIKKLSENNFLCFKYNFKIDLTTICVIENIKDIVGFRQ